MPAILRGEVNVRGEQVLCRGRESCHHEPGQRRGPELIETTVLKRVKTTLHVGNSATSSGRLSSAQITLAALFDDWCCYGSAGEASIDR